LGPKTPNISTFLSFSIQSSTSSFNIKLPSTTDDIKTDEQLPLIFEFLSSTKRPSGLDEKSANQLIRRAMRFFVGDSKLWRRSSSGMYQLVIFSLKKKRLSLTSHQLGYKQAFRPADISQTAFGGQDSTEILLGL